MGNVHIGLYIQGRFPQYDICIHTSLWNSNGSPPAPTHHILLIYDIVLHKVNREMVSILLQRNIVFYNPKRIFHKCNISTHVYNFWDVTVPMGIGIPQCTALGEGDMWRNNLPPGKSGRPNWPHYPIWPYPLNREGNCSGCYELKYTLYFF